MKTKDWGMEVALILAIDQGTTSTRAIVFDQSGSPLATVARELPQKYPRPGLVEHDPEDIWNATVEVCRKVLSEVDAGSVRGIGITNQRETPIIWDRETGRPRGFAFAEMANESEAQAAISALDGKDLDGRNLNVNEARPRENRRPRW